MAGHGDEGGPHLVRGERLPGQGGVAQVLVEAVVAVDEPFVEQVLQLGDAEKQASVSASGPRRVTSDPRRVTSEPVQPGRCWHSSALMVPKVRSTMPLAAGA